MSADGTILITGGSRGIGAATATLLADQGHRVVIVDIAPEPLEGTSAILWPAPFDVASESAVVAGITDIEKAHGPISGLVNAAGVFGKMHTIERVRMEQWDREVNIDLRGTFLVTHAFFGGMVERSYGRVINFASQLAYKGAPGLAHYCAAKAGIVGFTRALSYEGAPHGVMVNAIAPGPVETELLMGLTEEWRAMKKAQLPIGRFGQVEEIAPTVLLLASPAGAFYAGQTLSPNGGDVMV